jgi:hypothetical protein
MVIEAFTTINNMQEVGEDLNPTIGQPLKDPTDETLVNLHTQGDHGSFMEILFEKLQLHCLKDLPFPCCQPY